MTADELDNLGWIPAQDPADLHPAAHAAYLHARTRCRLLLFWLPTMEPNKNAPGFWVLTGNWLWSFRTPAGVEESTIQGCIDRDQLERWADVVLARLSLTDPTLGVPTEEG